MTRIWIRARLCSALRLSVACRAVSSSAALCMFLAGTAAAQNKAGVTAAPILQIPLGARAVAMGTAFTAVTRDLTSIYYNPAALATLDQTEASGMFLRGFDDQNTQSLEFGVPLGYAGMLDGGYVTAAGSLLFSQNGTIQYNQVDAGGMFLNSQTLSAGSDFVGTVSYAERALETPVEINYKTYYVNHFIGVSGKWINSTLGQQYSASAGAVDAGYLAQIPELGLSAGASVLNSGGKMAYVNEGDNLPLTGRLGAAYRVISRTSSPQVWTFALDDDYSVYERQWHVNAGVEYAALNSVAVRAGYQFNRDVAGLTVGFGARLDGLSLDYAWAMSSALSDEHRVSLTYRFPNLPSREVKRRSRQPYIMEDQKEAPPPLEDRPAKPKEKYKRSKDIPGWIY